MKLEEREYGVLAFVDDNGRVWAQCVKSSPNSPDYGIEGPLSGFVSEEGTFTMESERTAIPLTLVQDAMRCGYQ